MTVAAFPVAVETAILRLLETDDVLSVAVSCKVFSSAPLLCQLSLEHTVQLCGWSSGGIPVAFGHVPAGKNRASGKPSKKSGGNGGIPVK